MPCSEPAKDVIARLEAATAARRAMGDRVMAMAIAEIEAMIREALPDAKVEVRDLAGDGEHYAATRGQPRLQGQEPGAAAPDGLCARSRAAWAASCTRWR